MSTKVCPTCEGLCCREGSGMHSMHRVRVYTRHVCPDCDAGLVWATPAPARYDHRYRWSADGPECGLCGFIHQPNLEPLEES